MVESLPFLSNLKKLVIQHYAGDKFPEWMMRDMASHFRSLVELELMRCGCKQLPLMELLPYLNSLTLWDLGEVEYIDERTDVRLRNGPFFPSLEKLELWYLPKVKRWRREEVTEQNMLFFPRLSYLHILNCQNLVSIPAQPHLNKLKIENATIELLKKELTIPKIWKAETEASSSSSATSSLVTPSKLEEQKISSNKDEEARLNKCFQNLTSLKQCCISDFDNLKSIPDLGALTSLNSLTIQKCRSLESLPRGIQNLSELVILGCGFPLDDMDNVMPLKNLCRLCIARMTDVSLPSSLLNVTTLQTLEISYMLDLESLQDLPTSLQRLNIWHCPKLKERVRESEGEDWPKISHIPYIDFDGVVIKDMRRH